MRGRLIILSGPSGVGKDTVIDAWRTINPQVERVVAYTTRSSRPGEIADQDYHFVSKKEFLDLAEKGEFLEYKNVHGNYYGTPLTDTEKLLAAGKIAVLKIDVQGALEVKKLRPDAVCVFISPPSWEELERRIRGRGTDDEATISKRLANAHHEMETADQYHHILENSFVEDVVAKLQSIVHGRVG